MKGKLWDKRTPHLKFDMLNSQQYHLYLYMMNDVENTLVF